DGELRPAVRVARDAVREREREARARQEVALHELNALVAHGGELVLGLDALRHDLGAEVLAEADEPVDDALHARALVEVADELAIELHDRGLEIGDVPEVRVAGAEVVDDEARV